RGLLVDVLHAVRGPLLPTSQWRLCLPQWRLIAPDLFGLVPFQALDDLGDLDLGFADLAAAEVQEPGGAAELCGETVDVHLLAFDPLQDPLELVHRRPEARGLGLGSLGDIQQGLAHGSSTRLVMLPPESWVTRISPAAVWPGWESTAPAVVRVML